MRAYDRSESSVLLLELTALEVRFPNVRQVAVTMIYCTFRLQSQCTSDLFRLHELRSELVPTYAVFPPLFIAGASQDGRHSADSVAFPLLLYGWARPAGTAQD